MLHLLSLSTAPAEILTLSSANRAATRARLGARSQEAHCMGVWLAVVGLVLFTHEGHP